MRNWHESFGLLITSYVKLNYAFVFACVTNNLFVVTVCFSLLSSLAVIIKECGFSYPSVPFGFCIYITYWAI